MGSVEGYLKAHAKDFTSDQRKKILKGWEDFNPGAQQRKYYSFDNRKNYDYIRVFPRSFLMDPHGLRISGISEYGDANWAWFRRATDAQKKKWAKEQVELKFHVPVEISIGHRSLQPYFQDGHHRVMAAKVLGIKVPVVLERTRLPYKEAVRIIERKK